MSGELYYRGSSLYEDAVEDTLQYFENWEDQNVSAIRNDIRESSYNIANTVLGVGIGLNNNMRANTNNLMYGMQNMTYGIQGDIRESTRMVLASQAILAERFNQGFNSVNNNLNVGFSILASGMQTLSDDITSLATGMYAMTEALCNKLDDLHDILKNPLLTESRELYRRAENNFLRGYYEEALEDCQKAVEKNKTDFISWYLLGHIYLFGAGKFSNVIDVDKAEESFFNAAKYIDSDIGANEEANKLASEIYYYLGYARFIKSNDLLVGKKSAESKAKLIEAEKASREAYKLSNDNLIAAYEQAKELHFLEKDDEALLILENLIRTEINFALKASSDKNFESIWGKIEELIKKLRDEIVEKIKPELDEIDRQSKMLSDIKAWGIKDELVLAEIRQLLPPASIYETYFDVREFDETGKLKTLQQKMCEMIDCCMDKKYADSYFSTYKKAKEQYAAGNDKQTLDILKELIKAEWYFAVKSRCDIAFEKLWDKIDDLINNLRQESVFTMTPEIEEYNKQEKMLSEISAWGINTSDAFTTLKNTLSNPDIFETMDYFSVREYIENQIPDIRRKMEELIKFCCDGKEPTVGLETYNEACNLLSSGEELEALVILEELIREEWYFFIKARCDKTLEAIWIKIDDFINELRNEIISNISLEIEEYKRQAEMLSEISAWGIKNSQTLYYFNYYFEQKLPDINSLKDKDYFSVREYIENQIPDIRRKMEELIKFCCDGKEPTVGLETYYETYNLLSSGEEQKALVILEKLIREEWYFLIKARCDKKLETISDKINLLENKLKKELEKKIKSYESELQTDEQKTLADLKEEYTDAVSLNNNAIAEYNASCSEKNQTIEESYCKTIKQNSDEIFEEIENFAQQADSVLVKDYLSVCEAWEKLNNEFNSKYKIIVSNNKKLNEYAENLRQKMKNNEEQRKAETALAKKQNQLKKNYIRKGRLAAVFITILAETIPAFFFYLCFIVEHLYEGFFSPLINMTPTTVILIISLISGLLGIIFVWNETTYFEREIKGFLIGAGIGAIVSFLLIRILMGSSGEEYKYICIIFCVLYTLLVIFFVVRRLKEYMRNFVFNSI